MEVMPSRPAKLLSLLAAGTLVALAGCNREQPAAPDPSDTAAAAVEESASAEPSGESSGSASGIAADLDLGALQERRDPERLLRFYINAIRVGDYASAAKAWSLDAQTTPEKLKAEFGGDAGPKIALGKGDWGDVAGSVYYEAPITIDFPDGRPSRRGTVVLHRANDVPGASALQLVWRIERSSIVQ